MTVFELATRPAELTTDEPVATQPATVPAFAAMPESAEISRSVRAELAPPTAPSGPPVRFVVPICFEDTDPRLVARMFRPTLATGGRKRADLILNITNDGWFTQPQLSQHLQIGRFRSIENRAPTARAVNTGITAFVDSAGRMTDRLPTHVEGVATATLSLDQRLTLYTRFGDWFAAACTIATVALAVWALWRRRVEHA